MVCKHQHEFYTPHHRAPRRVLIVFLITLFTMFLEILAGYMFNSVALLADGIHMSTHAFAFAIAYMAYFFAKRWVRDSSFTFGTWKVEVLGAYSSSSYRKIFHRTRFRRQGDYRLPCESCTYTVHLVLISTFRTSPAYVRNYVELDTSNLT